MFCYIVITKNTDEMTIYFEISNIFELHQHLTFNIYLPLGIISISVFESNLNNYKAHLSFLEVIWRTVSFHFALI